MSEPDLDPALTARLVRLGGRDLLVRMIEAFTADAGPRTEVLRTAPDLPTVAATCHAIVAGAGQLGATRLSVEARNVEEAARAGQEADVRRRLPGLLDLYHSALTALARLREEG